MKYLAKLMAIGSLSLCLFVQAKPASVALELTTKLTQEQQQQLVAKLMISETAVAQSQAISYLTATLGSDAAAYWTTRIVVGGVTVNGLKALHHKLTQSNINEADLMRHIKADPQTSALVAAYTFASNQNENHAVASGSSTTPSHQGNVPKARGARTPAQFRATFDRMIAKALVDGEGSAQAKVESVLNRIREGVEMADPVADSQATNIGRAAEALERQGCSLTSSNDGTESAEKSCGDMKSAFANWIQLDDFTASAKSTDFRVGIFDNALGHRPKSPIYGGDRRVMKEMSADPVSYQAAYPDMYECYANVNGEYAGVN